MAEQNVKNSKTMARMLLAKTLIAPVLLEKRESLQAYAQLNSDLKNAGAGRGAPSSYAQAFSMTRFLMANMKAGQLPSFLLRVRTEQNFAAVVADQFDAELPQFYAYWYQDIEPSLR